MNYTSLKQLAKQNKIPVKDLIALAPQNDPFYVGAPAQKAAGEWFANLWTHFNMPNGTHIRRVHYKLVSQKEPVLMRNGLPYENTAECWVELNAASKAARYLGLVSISAFDDRRNPPPVIFDQGRSDGWIRPLVTSDWNMEPEVGEMPSLPAYHVSRPQPDDDYLVEVWCEKSTMNDVLIPVCEERGANLITGLGELSITAVNSLIERTRCSDKQARVLYISDFDPGGRSMPVAVARKAEFLCKTSYTDIQVIPIALNESQIEEYGLPRTPIKESERRKESFEMRHGTGATELDALEALHPGSLAQIVNGAIDDYRDASLPGRVTEAFRGICHACQEMEKTVYSEHQQEIDQAESEWLGIKTAIASWTERYQPVWQDISLQLEERIPEAVFTPKPVYSEANNWALFDSRREYIEQLLQYRKFQEGEVA